MCGIAGYFGTTELPQARVDATLALMRRRGPDHAAARHFATAAGRHVHLLHSRLSIVDLDERSNQPFHVAPLWTVYNGELYNYVEIKAELAQKGETFATTSDTEVLLRALSLHGPEILDRCEGMWAFAIFDERDGSLLLSRDRFGEKPLYLHVADDGVYFASEIKLIFALLGKRLPVDHDHLKRYLVNGYKALYKQPHSFFRGITEVGAGELMRIGPRGAIERQRYWKPSYESDEGMSYAEAVAGTRERLIRSVELRLRADVPLAFCMSGGVDSNALISIAKRTLGYDVHGFTIANSDERYEESDLVQHAVEALQLRHTSIPTSTANFLPRLRELVRYHDAPVYTITYYAHWLLMESIGAHGYRVSVSGTAADELFSGYYDHFLMYLAAVKSEPERHQAALAAWTEHIKPIVRNPFLTDPERFVRTPEFRDHIYLDADGFAGFLREPWGEPFDEERYTANVLRNRMLNELFHEAVPVILHEDDLNAMYYSIENRSPFLDRALFEWSCRIPARHLMRDGYAKAVLRDSMRGIVPDPILDSRRKVGFNAPIFSFLDPRDADTRAELLRDSPIFDLVRRDKIETLIDKAFLPNSQSKFLFYFLCAKLFLEEHGA
ncbi:MAG: asparagine synthase (glutamine-hydrolyzing) [Polyangia bacterium]